MRRCLCLVAWLWVSGLSVQAQEPWLLFDGCRWVFPKVCDQWRQRSGWCPDDYCGKILPAVPPNLQGCGDDYCPKPLPAVPPTAGGCADDYCPRGCPLFLGKLAEPWYRCGSPEDTGAGPCRRCPPGPR